MISAISPKEFGIAGDLLEDLRIDALGMCQDFFEQALFAEAVSGILIENDGVHSDGGHGKPVSENLAFQGKVFKALGVELQESGLSHLLDEGRR